MNIGKPEKQTRVAFYLRVSTEDQVEKHGLDVQMEALESLVHTRGKLDDGRPAMVKAGEQYIYVDDGVSGTIPPNERPAYARMTEDLANAPEGKKPFDMVAVFKIDRFARRLKLLLDITTHLGKEGIEFVSATEGVDTSTPFGRAMLGILGVISELELENIKSRTEGGRKSAMLKGVVMGANAKFGYIKDENKYLEPFDVEAKVVKEIFDLFVFKKQTTQQIANYLTESEIPSPNASAIIHRKHSGTKSNKTNADHFWRPSTVKTILTDEIYIGIYYVLKSKDGKQLPKDEWTISDRRHTPIITKQVFSLAQKEMENSTRRVSLNVKQKEEHIYLLSGLLHCHQCGNLPSKNDDLASWIGDKKRINKNQLSYYYKCGRKNRKKYSQICTTLPIPADEIEVYVTEFVLDLIQNPGTVYRYHQELASTRKDQKLQQKRREKIMDLLNKVPARRIRVRKQHEDGHITDDQLTERMNELAEDEKRYQQTLDEIDYRLSQIGVSEGYFKSFELFSLKYEGMIEELRKDREELYSLIHQLIGQIVVYSRPVTKKDKIAGRKTKETQYLPNKIDVHLNLPQHLLQELYTQKFGVRKSKW